MIDKDTLIFDALQQKPGSEEIFFSFGMHCLGCPASRGESIQQAAAAHGIDADKLIEALNQFEA